MSRKRQWSSDQLNSELKEWLSVLLEPVEVTGEGTEACLKELLSHKAGGVTKHYYETIKREVGAVWLVHCTFKFFRLLQTTKCSSRLYCTVYLFTCPAFQREVARSVVGIHVHVYVVYMWLIHSIF